MLVRSIQGKISLLLGLIIVFFSLLENLNMYSILIQIFSIYVITKNLECLVYGKCILGAWIGLLIPTVAILIGLMYKISYFDTYRNKFNKIFSYVNKVNRSRCYINTSNIIKDVEITHQDS
tara:strand:- start:71 stop:433 length:363 start_codon:yes stop_codon:yes gene_type:complete